MAQPRSLGGSACQCAIGVCRCHSRASRLSWSRHRGWLITEGGLGWFNQPNVGLWSSFVRRTNSRCLSPASRKDLGPLALPHIPPNPSPFTIAEYFPDPEISGFVDPRHHAVSLAYVVPVSGDCTPTQEALNLAWFTPAEAASSKIAADMTGGQDRLLRLGLAHVGKLP